MATGESSAGPSAIRPFTVEIPEADLEDLRARIAATRLPSKELVADRSQGVQLATIRALADYWATEYDFGRVEARLNALPQFTTEIDGVDIHFIHVKSRHENALPLIMTHGWPGSVIELLETIGPLTDPTAHGGQAEDAFHLVLPSLPGYGFSGEPADLGWNAGRVAQAWAELMHRLGYTRYVAQGGDVGALVTDAMGRQAPEGLLGIHMNLLVTVLAGAPPAESEQERAAAAQLATFREDGFGYFLEMATRPQTIGYALLDSPVALAAWLLDHDTDSYYKIARAFVDGEPAGNLTRDSIARQHHGVLADGHRRLGRPVVLGGRTSPGSSTRVRPGSSGRLAPGRLHHLPRRDLADPAQLGRELLPQRRLLQRGRQGRPLRRLGGAGALLVRGPGDLPVAAMTAFKRLHMPALGGATEWLNSEPLDPAGLRGRVVLVNFWTLTCINWLRQEPYVRAWSRAYRDDGLVVIGVHTPEFSFEHDVDGVRRATAERDIDYPVAVDNDYAIWSAFDNHYWPALYFIDADGIIADDHFGEGRYEESERVIQRLLGVERELVSAEGRGVEAEADWDHLRTPETYLGHGRGERFASPPAPPSTSAAPTSSPSACASTTGRSSASGRSAASRSFSRGPAEASPSASRRATRTSCSLRGREGRSPSACSSTARLRARQPASTSTKKGTACSATAASTSSCASGRRSASGRFRSPSSSPAPRRTRSRSGSRTWRAYPRCRSPRPARPRWARRIA